jgi:hypothetical protein
VRSVVGRANAYAVNDCLNTPGVLSGTASLSGGHPDSPCDRETDWTSPRGSQMLG